MLKRFVTNYIERHTHPLNRLLHLVGGPLSFVVSIVLLVEQTSWWWPLTSFLGGYLLQFLGHAIEGNDAGEVVLVKKVLGRPYREFAPGREPAGASTDDLQVEEQSRDNG